MRLRFRAIALLSTFFAAPLFASEPMSSETVLHSGIGDDSHFETPVGVGALAGDSSANHEYAFVIEGQNHFTQRRGLYGLTQYGQGESRLELGNGAGVSLQATSGVSVFGLRQDGRKIAPHLGVEPFDGLIHFNTNDHRSNAYEWLPMMSAGGQVAFASCRFLPLIRGGGAAGNITRVNYSPSIGVSYGAGAYLNCASLDLAAEATRILSQAQTANLRIADLSYRFSPDGIKLGVRGESELANQQSRAEQRILLILRSRIGD